MKYLILPLFFFLMLGASAQTRKEKINEMHATLLDHDVKNADIVLAISVLETGWFECKNCSLDNNNYFGFMTRKGYLKFNSMEESVKYMKRWQDKYYQPWLRKHPTGSFYDFLKHIGYAGNMDHYIAYLKRLQKDIKPLIIN